MQMVVTDLDGTFLNHDDYSWEGAREALAVLEQRGIPVIFCTSKTRAEVETLRAATGNRFPFIVENGGALFFPENDFSAPLSHLPMRDGYRVDELGTPYFMLVQALAQAAEETGSRVRGFATATREEVANWCGFSVEKARLAMEREYDEPFLLESGNPAALAAAIEARGFRWTRGGRFFHIMGANDKGAALDRLRAGYRSRGHETEVIALGDSPNDLPFLSKANMAILIPSPRLAEMREALPNAIVAPEPGSRGWGAAVMQVA